MSAMGTSLSQLKEEDCVLAAAIGEEYRQFKIQPRKLDVFQRFSNYSKWYH